MSLVWKTAGHTPSERFESLPFDNSMLQKVQPA